MKGNKTMRKLAYYALGLVLAALPILVSIPTIATIANSNLVFAHQILAILPIQFAWAYYWNWLFSDK